MTSQGFLDLELRIEAIHMTMSPFCRCHKIHHSYDRIFTSAPVVTSTCPPWNSNFLLTLVLSVGAGNAVTWIMTRELARITATIVSCCVIFVNSRNRMEMTPKLHSSFRYSDCLEIIMLRDKIILVAHG